MELTQPALLLAVHIYNSIHTPTITTSVHKMQILVYTLNTIVGYIADGLYFICFDIVE